MWVDNQKVSIEKSNNVIIAVPPIKQSIMIKKCLEFKTIKNIFLEKPLAQSPIESSMVLNILNTSKVNYAINYSFIYLELLHKKLLSVNLKCELNLNWEFMAHHYIKNLDTWKNKHSHGGGALRFYGIHVIALLAYVGYNNII